jgi:hypothetical protein
MPAVGLTHEADTKGNGKGEFRNFTSFKWETLSVPGRFRSLLVTGGESHGLQPLVGHPQVEGLQVGGQLLCHALHNLRVDGRNLVLNSSAHKNVNFLMNKGKNCEKQLLDKKKLRHPLYLRLNQTMLARQQFYVQ